MKTLWTLNYISSYATLKLKAKTYTREKITVKNVKEIMLTFTVDSMSLTFNIRLLSVPPEKGVYFKRSPDPWWSLSCGLAWAVAISSTPGFERIFFNQLIIVGKTVMISLLMKGPDWDCHLAARDTFLWGH